MPISEYSPGFPERFAQTQWSLVLAAGFGDGSGAAAALAQLCQTYWYPLYAFVRRQGYSHHDAQDLTQAFFGKLLEKNYLADADRGRGRFRTFLLASLKHFLANEWDRRRAKKRGGGIVFIPLDPGASERYSQEPASTAESPDEVFERRWALTVLQRGLAALRESYAAKGQEALFAALKPSITGERGDVAYRELGEALGMEEGAVKVAAHRLRQRYRKALRAEIERTVENEAEVEDEFRYLREVLSKA